MSAAARAGAAPARARGITPAALTFLLAASAVNPMVMVSTAVRTVPPPRNPYDEG